MNTINALMLTFIVVCLNPLFGMDFPDTIRKPIIVNCNEGDSIPEDTTAAIIFGATPRLSRFHEFTHRVVSDIQEIIDAKPKGMRKDLKKLTKEKRATLLHIQNFLNEKPREKKALHCFFAHGFNTDLLTENMNTLMGITRKISTQNFIHIFLPSYFEPQDFAGIPEKERHEFLKDFLVHSAQFYKKLYEAQNPTQQIYIVIPPIENFIEKITTQSDDTEHTIATVLKEQLFDIGIKKALLLNQNAQQLENLGKKIQRMGFSAENITLLKFTLYEGCSESKIFTPYTIPSKRIPSPLLSCVLSENLVETYEALGDEK